MRNEEQTRYLLSLSILESLALKTKFLFPSVNNLNENNHRVLSLSLT